MEPRTIQPPTAVPAGAAPAGAQIPVVASERHRAHDVRTELIQGRPEPAFEVVDRVERIRTALADDPDGTFAFQEPNEHGIDPITAVHDPALVAYLESAWRDATAAGLGDRPLVPATFLHARVRDGFGPAIEPRAPLGRMGYWCFDVGTPILEGTYGAARAAVDIALTAADLVLDGAPLAYGLCRPPGHHAGRSFFGGYCYLNNAAIAADWIARRTGTRVGILDLDYHHGNGTQEIFFDRSDVLYASIHGDPRVSFPYVAGHADETGAGHGAGATLNLPLPHGTDDAAYRRALDRALEWLGAAGPATIVVSLGFDTFRDDPICHFALTTPVYRTIGERVATLGRPLVVLQEGGYDLEHLGVNALTWLEGAAGRRLTARR